MPDYVRWILAVGILLLLLAIFVITFVLYKKTPVPKGCEEFEKPSEAKCHGCNQTECHFNLYYNDPIEKAKEELQQEEKEQLQNDQKGEN
jgi:flagellar basal body-associated protein FliL